VFRHVDVAHTRAVNARTCRITLAGPALHGFAASQPAASVRLLVPSSGADELVIPQWNGNEFLLPGGARPALRTFTPLSAGIPNALDLEIVLHGAGVVSTWAERVDTGAPAAVSGPGRGYDVDPDATAFLLAGDESAVPALLQVLDAVPAGVPVDARLAVPDNARRDLEPRAATTVSWHQSLIAAVHDAVIPDGARIWVAGEAAAVQQVRRHLFESCGIPRARTSVRGYWKHGRAGD
jgi:NADPH-dependent ferric siderophore reductase